MGNCVFLTFAYNASNIPVQGKRIKFAAVLVFGALSCAAALAHLREKADLSLHTPEDVVRCVGLRIIGTTTRSANVKKTQLPKRIADDYHTIFANLGLFSDQHIPRKLAITSPGPKEGKTTLAINLATSIAGNGKKVLLIDGDFRKPDIAKYLMIDHDKGFRDLFFGADIQQVVFTIHSAGFDVLKADVCESSEIYQLIAQQRSLNIIEKLSKEYDHIIIDSPPVLAVPDALLWAKMVDEVILTSFAGQTEAPALKETLQRLRQINVKVLGTVLNNVPPSHHYNPYGYGYSSGVAAKYARRGSKKGILLPMNQSN